MRAGSGLIRPGGRSGRSDGGDARELASTLAILWFAGAALRVTILALPPVLPRVTADLGLGAGNIGVLAGLPPLLFALAALPSASLIARFGPVATLALGLLLDAGGAAARGLAPGIAGLEAATALMCLGVAVMQPALPPLVRAWAPERIGFATAVYTNGLLVGEVLPTAWVPQPILPLVGGGWRATLSVWALPVLATLVGLVLSGRRSPVAGARTGAGRADWRDRRMWRAGLLLGGINATYFGLNGFLPGWLGANGRPTLVQPALVALNLAQLPASLLMLAVAGRWVRVPAVYGCAGALLVAGVTVAILAPGAAVPAAALSGFAGAVLLTLALALPSLLGAAGDVPRLSAAMFTISYGFAMASAFLAGRLWEASGLAVTAMLPFAVTAALTIVLGLTLRFEEPAEPEARG